MPGLVAMLPPEQVFLFRFGLLLVVADDAALLLLLLPAEQLQRFRRPAKAAVAPVDQIAAITTKTRWIAVKARACALDRSLRFHLLLAAQNRHSVLRRHLNESASADSASPCT